MKEQTKEKKYNLASYAVFFVLLIGMIFIQLFIRHKVVECKDIAVKTVEESQMNVLDSILEGAIKLGRCDLEARSQTIESEINTNLDLDRLESYFEGNTDYPEFDSLLRENLQNNVFINGTTMDQNRNSIFVIVNEKIIASYTHDDSNYKIESKNIHDIINSDSIYNKELAENAINLIENQYSGLIVWQNREPSIKDLPKYSSINISTINSIFREYGLEGLESYDILIPVYITRYGNLFGEYDIPGQTSPTSNNKIIIIQKLNLADYIKCNYASLSNITSVEEVTEKYMSVIDGINIAICIHCIIVIAYSLMFVSLYNHKLILQDKEEIEIIED